MHDGVSSTERRDETNLAVNLTARILCGKYQSYTYSTKCYIIINIYICNLQCDAQNTHVIIIIPAFMQPPFKFQSPANQRGQLVLVTRDSLLLNLLLI